MGATLTLSSLALGLSGKVLAATIGGGTGSGNAITDKTGISVVATANSIGVPISSVSVSGSTLTVNLSAAVASTETCNLSIATGANLTDSGGNTAQGQSSLSVNVSAVTAVTTELLIASNSDKIHVNGAAALVNVDGRLGLSQGQYSAYGSNQDYPIEFVYDGQDIVLVAALSGNVKYSIDGGSEQTYTLPSGFGGGTRAFHTLATGLSAGKHLVRIDKIDYWYFALRITGGNRTLVSVAPTTAYFDDSIGGDFYGGPISRSPVRLFGAYTINASGHFLQNGSNIKPIGMQFDLSAPNTAMVEVVGFGSQNILTIDGGAESNYVAQTWTESVYRVRPFGPLMTGGTTHTYRCETNNEPWLALIRVRNVVTLTSSATAGSNVVLAVSSTTGISVGNWVRIDTLTNAECCQVTAIGTGTITVGSLASNHSNGIPVLDYSAPTGTIVENGATFAKKSTLIGDSNTEAITDYWNVGSNDGTNPFYWWDYRWGYTHRALHTLGYDDEVNIGVSGDVAGNSAGRSASLTTIGNQSRNLTVASIGTNDQGAGNTSLASYRSSIDTIIANVQAAYGATHPIVFVRVFNSWNSGVDTPNGTTGLTKANYNAVLDAAALTANGAGGNVQVVTISQGWPSDTSYGGDPHPNDAGHALCTRNLVPYLASIFGAGYTASGASGTVTVTRAGSTAFVNLNGYQDSITLSASAGNITVTAASGTITNNGTGTVTVKPSNSATTFSYTCSATATITYTNAQGWANPGTTSYTADTTPPTQTAASINSAGTTLSLTFSESVTGVSATDYTLSTGQTLSAATGSGTAWTMTITPAVNSGAAPTLAYAGTATVDGAGNALATFSGHAITNGSTHSGGGAPPNPAANLILSPITAA